MTRQQYLCFISRQLGTVIDARSIFCLSVIGVVLGAREIIQYEAFRIGATVPYYDYWLREVGSATSGAAIFESF
jgi:hypothetical protein